MEYRPSAANAPAPPAVEERTLHELVPLDAGGTRIHWDAVVKRCHTHPEEASLPYDLVGQENELVRAHGPTVLHVTLTHDPPPEAVSAVWEAFPDALRVEAYEPCMQKYCTPLELARRNGDVPFSIVHLLETGRKPTLHELVPPREGVAGIDFEAVIARCTSHPEEASRPYGDMKPSDSPTVLHVLLMNTPPLEAVRAVVAVFPDALGMTAYFRHDRARYTPLELAVGSVVSPHIASILGGRTTATIAADDDDGDGGPTLHELVPLQCSGADIDPEAVIARCTSHPQEASRRYGDIDSPTVLHVLLMNSPSPAVVRAVLEACPAAIDKVAYEPVEQRHYYPLQVAITRRLSPSTTIISSLVAAYFGERRRKADTSDVDWFEDIFGGFERLDHETLRVILTNLPLDLLTSHVKRKLTAEPMNAYFGYTYRFPEWAGQNQESTWDILQLVLGFVTHGTVDQSMLNNHSHCYLQAIFEASDLYTNNTMESLRTLLKKTKPRDPSQFSARSSSGRLPLHMLLSPTNKFALSTPSVNAAVIKLFLGEHPQAAGSVDPVTRELPLHTVLKGGLLPFEDLLAAEPRVLRTRNTEDRLYPFEAAMLHWASRRTSGSSGRGGCFTEHKPTDGLDAAYTILREEPSLLGARVPLVATRMQRAVPAQHVPAGATVGSTYSTTGVTEEKRRRKY